MLKLLQCDMPELLERLRIIKEFYEEGAHNIVPIFSKIEIDTDDFEMLAYEEMWSLPGYLDNHELYYGGEHTETDEDGYREAYGEEWTFATEEMREYYRLLKELKKSGKISRKTYALKMNEMEKYASMYIVDSQEYYSGVFCRVKYGKAHCIKVYLEFDYCYSAFRLCCGIIAILDKYAEKLKELQDEYCNEDTMLEAA